MAISTINLGTPPLGAGGDTIIQAMVKINAMLVELYGRPIGGGTDVGPVDGASKVGYALDTTIPQTVQTVLSALPINPVLLYKSSDNNDYFNAVVRAAALSNNIVFPAGSFYISQPFDIGKKVTVGSVTTRPYEGISITGQVLTRLSGTAITKITCPNGFIVNSYNSSPGDRIRPTVKNLHLYGQASGSTATAINGCMGGEYDGLKIEGFANGIVNPDAFLAHYWRCGFVNISGFGISLADANGARISDGSFSSDVRCHISLLDVTPTPGGGGNDGEPMIITGNNHNAGVTYSNQSIVRLRGLFEYSGNYIEQTGSSGTNVNVTMLEILVDQNDMAGFSVFNNILNGQGHARCGIQIRGSSSLDCRAFGSIWQNQLQGFVLSGPSGGLQAGGSIWYGNFDGTNNRIAGTRIYDNYYGTNHTSDDMVLNLAAGCHAAPLCFARSNPSSLSAAGTTFVALPIYTGEQLDLGGLLSSSQVWVMLMNWKQTGYWEFECIVSSDAPTTSCIWQTSPSGSSTYTQVGLEFVTGYNGTIKHIAKLNYGDKIKAYARNGGNITGVQFVAKYLGDRLA